MVRNVVARFLDAFSQRRTLGRLTAAALTISAFCLCQAAVVWADVPRIQAGRIRVEMDRFSNSNQLRFPVFMTTANDGSDRLFFVEKGIGLYPQPSEPPYGFGAGISMYTNGTFSTFLDLPNEIYPYSESGTLGLAFHPGFANPASPGYRKFYTFHSSVADENATVDFDSIIEFVDHHNVLTEWQVSAGNPNVVDLSSRREVFRESHPSDVHNSGTIAFGPDGYLYGSIGTPTGGSQSLLRAQDNSDILGTIYRIDPLAPSLTSGSSNPISANGKYRIPADNPFIDDPTALGEIYAYGFRNAFRFAFDPVSGLLFAGDVGEATVEELNVVPKGGNMGWPYFEGNSPGSLSGAPPGTISPLAEYLHSDGSAIVGGVVYHGSIEALQNKYIFGDFSNNFFSGSGRLLVADVFDELGQLKAPGEVEIQEMLLAPATCGESIIANPNCSFDNVLMSFGLDEDGELYVIGYRPNAPMIYKITDAYVLPKGDYNEDGMVDAADYTVWRNTLGQSVPFGTKADGNGSGTIDAGDYQVWKNLFGETTAFGSAGSSPINVPGPHSFILAFQILLGVLISIRPGAMEETLGNGCGDS